MIDRLQPHDPPLEPTIVCARKAKERELCGGWPDHEDVGSFAQARSHLLEEPLLIFGASFAPFGTSRVLVGVSFQRDRHQLAILSWARDWEESRLTVINPNGRLLVHRFSNVVQRSSVGRYELDACIRIERYWPKLSWHALCLVRETGRIDVSAAP